MTQAGERLIEGAKEALSVARGEQPAASVLVGGQRYYPKPEWQPIETAPKDGANVLLYAPGVDAPYWMCLSSDFPRSNSFESTSIVVGRLFDGVWVCHVGESTYEDSTAPSRIYPTHWMPLPPPPATAAPHTPSPPQPL